MFYRMLCLMIICFCVVLSLLCYELLFTVKELEKEQIIGFCHKNFSPAGPKFDYRSFNSTKQDFIERIENLHYDDAVRLLAGHSGISGDGKDFLLVHSGLDNFSPDS